MMFAAVKHGFRDALRLDVVLPLYIWGLLLGLVQTWPLLVAAQHRALNNPYLGQLASGGADALVNLFLGSPAAGAQAGIWSLTLVILLVVYSLGYNFISGGMLNVWAEKSSFGRGGMWAFWSFTGLGALLVLLAVLASGIAAAVAVAAGPQIGITLAAVLLQIINMAGEYARAIAVVENRRNPFALLGRAFAFCARRPGTLLLALVGVLLNAALTFGAVGALPLVEGGVVAVVVQQVFAFGWVWIKSLRLAWALNYVETAEARQLARPLEAVLGPARS
jgi:hypothetical protein